MMTRCPCFVFPLLLLLGTLPAGAQDGPLAQLPGRVEHDDSRLNVILVPRTPQQMAAFYEGRGFPDAMIDLTRRYCFVTVLLQNKTEDILWHELERWRFVTADGTAIARRSRDWWQAQWETMQAPLPSRSTFRWTLLPERLDFHPGEREGGNITLERTGKPLRLIARFATGTDRTGEEIILRLDGLRCAGDQEP
ncbi:hypothetical protein [Thiohalobacter thiocyanaticus]|uniref:hypothetical protein n=1 Tax=Thiohalobacter thiocyanaticus TaxID=585455 RepID=UPI001319E2CB|nr:hypothetical protein [Thiohalobacter thiocyanaticus]